MHIRTAVLAALVAAGPAVAFAQVTPSASPPPATTEEARQAAPAAPAAPPAPVAAAAPAEQPPKWTIGAGIGTVGYWQLPTPSPGSVLSLSASFGQSIPVATFFLERRVGERTWLVFGAAGTVNRDRFDAPPDIPGYTVTALTKDEAERGSLSAGLRRVVTRSGALVEVSLQAVLEGGYVHELQEITTSAGAKSEVRDTGGYGAVTAGIVVERELTGGLALRLSTPLVGASWSQIERKDSAGTRDGSSASVFVTVSPRLELRLAF